RLRDRRRRPVSALRPSAVGAKAQHTSCCRRRRRRPAVGWNPVEDQSGSHGKVPAGVALPARITTKHLFVTGGVASSLGKGLTASSLGRLLKSRGLRVTMQKLDPYLNVDPGTMNPFQHGEVFVTADGGYVVIHESGGTGGNIESQPFLASARQVRHEIGRDNVLFLHVSLVPYIGPSGEPKTKPTQHSVAELRSIGIQPDAIVFRSDL